MRNTFLTEKKQQWNKGNVQPTVTLEHIDIKEQTSIFIPYWNIPKDVTDISMYDTYIYFGITPTVEHINKKDAGYLRLEQFKNAFSGKQTYLTVRMLDSQDNFKILKDHKKQATIISEVLQVVKEYNFEGVILDLELSALPFESLIKQINSFTKDFSAASKKEKISFSMTLYGDTYYRVRPFELQTLGKYVDQIFIMAYDLHKAGGNPGPNFPLSGNKEYGYDYSLLIDKLLEDVRAENITIVFGLFGYDWEVDGKNISQKIGKPLSFNEIQTTIIAFCKKLSCNIYRDPLSKETRIDYIESGTKHRVWFEDTESVSTKRDYLKKRGINNFSYWAYSYF